MSLGTFLFNNSFFPQGLNGNVIQRDFTKFEKYLESIPRPEKVECDS